MENCFGNLQFWWCIIYLDNFIIFAATLKEHLETLHTLLSWPDWNCNLLSVSFSRSVWFIWGNIISKDGIQTDGHKVKAIKNWSVPITVTDLRSFVGFPNYYWCFIKGYAKVACSLYDQISGDNAAHKKRRIQLTDECQKALIHWRFCALPPNLGLCWLQ